MTRRGRIKPLGGVLALFDARSLPSEDLLGRYLSDRDEVAFRALVERYAGLVSRRCRAALRRDDLAADAFQETFLRLVTHGHAVRRAGRVGAWLVVTAARIAGGMRAADGRRRAREMAAAADPDRTPPVDPAEATAGAELGGAVLAALARLPDGYRLPLECVYLDGMTHAEAARALGLPKGTVDSAVARGLKRLRDATGKLGLAGPVATAGLDQILAAQARATPPGWVAATVRAATAAVPRPTGLVEVVRAYAATRPVGRGGAVLLAGCLGFGIAVAARPDPVEADPPPARVEPARHPAEPLTDRNRRVLEADTLPKVVEALRPLALNGGDVRVTRVVAHDFRAWFEVEARHHDTPAGAAPTRFRFHFNTRTRVCIVQAEEPVTKRFQQVNPDTPLVLLRVPELGIKLTARSEPLERAIAVLREFPPDPRAEDEAVRHCDAVARAVTPLTGLWRFRGEPGRPLAWVRVPPGLRPGDDVPVPGPATTHLLKAHDLVIGPEGRFRIWWDDGWYRLTDGGRRLELSGSDAWWERADGPTP